MGFVVKFNEINQRLTRKCDKLILIYSNWERIYFCRMAVLVCGYGYPDEIGHHFWIGQMPGTSIIFFAPNRPPLASCKSEAGVDNWHAFEVQENAMMWCWILDYLFISIHEFLMIVWIRSTISHGVDWYEIWHRFIAVGILKSMDEASECAK